MDGYDVAYFRWVANAAGWAEVDGPDDGVGGSTQIQFYFKCQSLLHPEVMKLLVQNGTLPECAVALGGITITPGRTLSGVQFAPAYLHTGLGIMVPMNTQTSGMWGFLKPFSTELWIAYLLAFFGTTVLVYLCERLSSSGQLPGVKEMAYEWGEVLYKMALGLMGQETFRAFTFPAQLLIICFAYFNLIVISTYTGSLAAWLTVSESSPSVKTVAELRGTTVATYSLYSQGLRTVYGVESVALDGDEESVMAQALGMISRREVSAFVQDYIPSQMMLPNMDAGCRYKLLDSLILPFGLGIAFHKDFPSEVINGAFYQSMLDASEQHQLNDLSAKFFGKPPPCTNNEQQPVSFKQMSGLLLITGLTVAVAVVWALVSITLHVRELMRQHMRQMEAEHQAALAKSGPSFEGDSCRSD